MRTTSFHEFLPTWLMYGPVYTDYIKTALQLKTFKYPLIVNPMIELGGFIGEQKYEILSRLPKNTYPQTTLIDPSKLLDSQFSWTNLQYIAKPDQGERGIGVRHITSKQDLTAYHAGAPRTYILQEYVDFPLEFGLFFVRTNDAPLGKITSLCKKEAAIVAGDGRHSLRELCWRHPRFQRQVARLENYITPVQWDRVLGLGETFSLDVVRNHRRGACFRDARPLITKKMTETFQNILPEGCGFNYGRIDLRAKDLNSFQDGLNFQILEVNGVTSEPGEIYDPDMSLKESLSILRRHWDYVAEIAQREMNHTPLPSALAVFDMFKSAMTRPPFTDK